MGGKIHKTYTCVCVCGNRKCKIMGVDMKNVEKGGKKTREARPKYNYYYVV